MSFEYLTDPERGPRWRGLLPGAPEPFFLRRGEGEHARLFGDLFTVLLSGDETDGQFHVHTVLRTPHGNDYGRAWVREWQRRGGAGPVTA